jgi:hypothetical protein
MLRNDRQAGQILRNVAELVRVRILKSHDFSYKNKRNE